MSWTDAFMDIPHVPGGRSRAGADCFGLYAIVLEEAAGVTVDRYAHARFGATGAGAIATAIARGDWRCIARGEAGTPGLPLALKQAARRFDAVLMTAHVRVAGAWRRADLHIGCAVGNGLMLHSEGGAGPQLVAIDDPSIAHRLRGVYRPAALTERAA
jgi:cell wall-associated NlpC family hydrolase